MNRICLLVIAIILTTGCGLKERENALDQKAKNLNEKEQHLLSLEKQLQLREEDLTKREKVLDSTHKLIDSIGIFNQELVGKWQIKMSCTETTCAGSAIGDTQTEQWEIAYVNNNIIVNAFAGKKLVRVYSGTFNEGVLHLSSQNQPAAETMIIVNLRYIKINRMEGERIISQEGNCKIVYALQADKL